MWLISEQTQPDHERLTRFVRESLERYLSGTAGDPNDNALAIPVRKLGPSGPRGQAGAEAKPEVLFFE
jgi:hypothetical protein